MCPLLDWKLPFYIFMPGAGQSFAYVAHFVFLGDVWIRTQKAADASRCATNLATHSPMLSFERERQKRN